MGIINTYCRTLSVILMVTMIGFACSTPKVNQTIEATDKPEIVFVVFNINRDQVKQKSSLQVIEKIKTDGTFKDEVESHWTSGSYLTFELYENERQIRKFNMEHPLYKKVEYPEGENMSSKQLELTEAEFFIRIQITKPNTKLKVFETIDDHVKNELASINL